MLKQQRGSVEIIVIAILAIGVAAGATFAVHSYNKAIEEAQQAKVDLKQSQDNEKTLMETNADERVENARLVAKQELMDSIQKDRNTTNAKIAAIQRGVDEKLAAAIKNSPAVRAWWDMPVPDAVLASVREPVASAASGAIGQGSAGSASGGVDKPNYNPGVAVRPNDQRRSVQLGPATGSGR